MNMGGDNVPRRYFFVFSFILALSKGCIANLKTIYVEDICRTPVTYYLDIGSQPGWETSGIISASRQGGYDGGFDCKIVILPKTSGSVILSVYKVALWADDHLTIRDANGYVHSFHDYASYQDERKSFFSRGHMTIHYKTGNFSDYQAEVGFQFTYTEATDYPCFVNEYQCGNQRCIWEGLACDGHNHCGDNSDQRNCVPRSWLSTHLLKASSKLETGKLIGIIFGAFSLVMILSALIYFIFRRKRIAKKGIDSPETIEDPRIDVNTLPNQPPTNNLNPYEKSAIKNFNPYEPASVNSMKPYDPSVNNISPYEQSPINMSKYEQPSFNNINPYEDATVNNFSKEYPEITYTNIYPDIQPPTAPDFEETLPVEEEMKQELS